MTLLSILRKHIIPLMYLNLLSFSQIILRYHQGITKNSMVVETELVKKAKLNVQLSSDQNFSKHCTYEFPVHDILSGRILCSRWESWYQHEEISRGSFGRVSKQTAFSPRSKQLRAVKQVTCRTGSTSLDYKRELNTVFQFSQSKVESHVIQQFSMSFTLY